MQIRLPTDFDPSELNGAKISLSAPTEIKGRGGRRLQAHPAPIAQGNAGAGKPVVVIRQSLSSPLLPVAALSTRVVITEGLGVSKPSLPPSVALAAAGGDGIKQLEGLDYRYIPFGAAASPTAVATPARKRKREDKDTSSAKSSSKHDKKEKKHSKKEKKSKKDRA